MLALAPVALTANNTSTITFDSSVSAQPVQGLIIQNQSGFNVVLTFPDGSHTLGPWINDFFPVTTVTTKTIQATTNAGQIVNAPNPQLVVTIVWNTDHRPVGYPMANPTIVSILNQTNNPVTVDVLQLPAPPSTVNYSVTITATGSAQILTAAVLTVGLAFLADINNAGKFYIGATNVTTGSAYLSPGQGVVLPVQNANEVAVLGTSGDYLSVWGA